MAQRRGSKSSSTGRKSPKATKTTKSTPEIKSQGQNTNKSKRSSSKINKKNVSAGTSKMTMCTVPLVAPRSPTRERRTDRRVASGKRLAMARAFPGKIRAVTRRSLDPCDNSNDSGLGFDNHVDHHTSIVERLAWSERAEAKRPRLDIKVEDDEVNDNFSFPESIRTCKDNMSIIRTAPTSTAPALSIHGSQTTVGPRAVPRCAPLSSRSAPVHPVTLTSQLSNLSREGGVSLRIIHQPEQQHRARYQTEGSRGAVKDRSGNGFPVVQLTGYNKPTTLQVFIGTDVGKVAPHMFYQACRVSGKNSTPCIEKKIDGTVVIELQLDPTKDMTGVCDCVGILKERNVDVEHRFPDQIGSRSKKKSTRCRMIFRTIVLHDSGVQETLQVCSQPIVCTQPPGIPEICKKSLTSCPATGGLELFILGKNFLKDTKVFFQQADEQGLRWEQFVIPDKEFLQQTHLVCVIPPYARPDITEPVTVRLLVVSSGKTSEPHQFVYTPTSGAVSSARAESSQSSTFMSKSIWSSVNKHEQGIMPPPGTNQMPLSQRRPSINITSEAHSPPLHSLKQELIDENSQNSILDPLELHRERFRHISESSLDVHAGDSNMSMINESSMDMLRRSSVSLDAMNHINENSMSSIHENSVDHVMVRRNSGGSQSIHENSMDVPSLVNPVLPLNDVACLPPNGLTPNGLTPAIREELAVMDLRMKATVADLMNTCTAPSLATLQSFGVTEPTNVPLPAQTAQSIENYLSTIETKPVNVDAMTLNNNSLQLTQILNTQSSMQAQKLISTTPSLSQLAQLNGTNFNGVRVPQPTLNMISNPNVTMVEGSILNTKPLMNSPVEKADRNVHSPQDMLIGNKSPLISSASQDVLMNTSPQAPLMVSPNINTSLSSPTLEQSEVNVSAQTSSNISPDIILNSQISPSMMCRNTTSLTQEGLLTTICQPSVTTDSGIIQSQLNMAEPQQTTLQNSPLAPLLTTDTSPRSSLTPNHSPVLSNQLTTMIHATDPEKAILFKATVDLLETQKKLSELETLAVNSSSTCIEQVIMNDILSSSNASESNSQTNNLQQANLTANLIASAEGIKDFVAPVNGVKEMPVTIQSEKKNEDRMIPSGFATMSENELINIINPSCFDQV